MASFLKFDKNIVYNILTYHNYCQQKRHNRVLIFSIYILEVGAFLVEENYMLQKKMKPLYPADPLKCSTFSSISFYP